MSQGPPTPPERTSSEGPRVRFNWPPTEDELAQYSAEGLRPDTEFEAAGLEGKEPLAAGGPPAALFTLPEPPRATAVDPPRMGDFADEIAHLQALIEGLTQKIEWRLPNVARR